MRLRRILKFLWFVFGVFAPALPILVPALGTNNLAVIILTPTWITWCLTLLYNQWDWFYFWVNRSFLWLANSEVKWTVSIELDGPSDEQIRSSIYNSILTAYPKAAPWGNSNTAQILKLPQGFMIRFFQADIVAGPDATEDQFFLEVSDMVVPFRQSDKNLETIVTLISEIVLPVIRPRHEKYTLKVSFAGANPYFGLFVRRLRVPEQELVSFRCEFYQKVGHVKEKVSVSQERVALTAHSLTGLQLLSKRYITLASLDLSATSQE